MEEKTVFMSGEERLLRAIFGEKDAPLTDANPDSASGFKTKLREVLSTLTLRERIILQLRFGFNDYSSESLGTLSELFKVTPERVRQIEAKALRKMRHPIRLRQLLGFFKEEEQAV